MIRIYLIVSLIRPSMMGNRRSYALNGAETAKLPLEILLVGLVRESRNNQSLEGIAANVGVLVGFDCTTVTLAYFSYKSNM